MQISVGSYRGRRPCAELLREPSCTTTCPYMMSGVHYFGELTQHVPNRRDICLMIEEATVEHRVRVWVRACDMDGTTREGVFCGRRFSKLAVMYADKHTKVLEHREILSGRDLKPKVSSC